MKKNEKNLEMIKLIKEEKREEKKKIKFLKNKLKKLNNKIEEIIFEIRMGTGGVESTIFISDLKKMYEKYIKKMNWKKKIISEIKTCNGYREVVMILKGLNVYKTLKFESGVHRVQRTPKTENKGRLHTSTCKIAVYKNKKIKKIKINDSDLKIETFKASGAGGQHVNKTNSAVRIKHIPTNIVVECQKERSQHKNKKYALKIIKIKILSNSNKNNKNNKNKIKKNLLGKGLRSEKIRTYNYKNNKITDHRFKININKLNKIIKGEFEILIKKIKNVKKNKKI